MGFGVWFGWVRDEVYLFWRMLWLLLEPADAVHLWHKTVGYT